MVTRTAVDNTKRALAVLNNQPSHRLQELPGVGPKTAEKILSLRASCRDNGQQIRIGDCLSVRGINAGLLAKIAGDDNVHSVIKYGTLYEQIFAGSKSKVNRVILLLHHLIKLLQAHSKILSIDLGIHNSAYVLINAQYSVQEWKKLKLGMPSPYTPGVCFNQVMHLMSR